jgi:NADPH:quinone reductase-like Zn-dependent oxidoreductase
VRQFPAPVAGAGEVVIDVAVAPVLFLDTQIRAGLGRDWFPVRPPYVPGAGVAGTVGSAGTGVEPAWVGRRVVADTPAGGYLEQAVVPVGRLVPVPGGAGPSLVLDGIGGDIGRAAFDVTADGGRFSAHGTPGGGFASVKPGDASERGIEVLGIDRVQLEPAEATRLTGLALTEAASGRIKPVIGQTFSLKSAADAHRAIESRAVVGKTLLEA